MDNHYLSKVLGKGLADKVRYISRKSREKRLGLPVAMDFDADRPLIPTS